MITYVSGTAVGLSADGKDLVNDDNIQALEELIDITVARLMKPWLMFDFIFNLTSYKTRMVEKKALLSQISVEVSI